MKTGVFAAFLALFCWTSSAPFASANETAQSAIQVVASIRPLALIAEDILGPMGEVSVLVPGAASPHDYSLRVSDVQRLRTADLVIWMGADLERFLEKPLAALPGERVVTLTAAEAGDGGHHDHSGADPHQWLDPRLAQEMARTIAARLQRLYPSLKGAIQARLEAKTAAYEDLYKQAQQALEPVQDVGFVVEHRGYDHFVETFGLNQLGWLSATPEQPPGVRHLYDLEKRLRSGADARCLFMELAHQSSAARNLASQLELRPQTLDILGHNAGTYEELIRHMVADVLSCLLAS